MHRALLFVLAILTQTAAASADDGSWPPPLRGAVNGTVTFSSPELLTAPDRVAALLKPTALEVAAKPPTIDLAFHDQLGPKAADRRLWSSWGDICVASDGRVYCA